MNQYGRGGRAAHNWGPDTIEGDLSEQELRANCYDQTIDNIRNRFLDDEYYASRDYNLSDIQVPLLSVGNWGGILLHLRGNVEGFMHAGSKQKYLRFVTGRHDLPFYSKASVDLQRSFLDAFLKDDDREGWTKAIPPRVSYKARIGDVGVNNVDADSDAAYPTRTADVWPIPGTDYVKYHLEPAGGLTINELPHERAALSYKALADLKNQHFLHFTSARFREETEFTGHIVARLNVSVTPEEGSTTIPSDIDLFLTVRHLGADGKEILYTGTVGDPVPVTKGWLRVSLRKENQNSPRHKFWHPHREYLSSERSPLELGQVYTVDVEIWPSNVVMSVGDQLVLELSSGDTQGAGLFEHNSAEDRNHETFAGINHLHFGPDLENWLMMPRIPQTEAEATG